jgi:hypothetical protein
MGSEWNYGDAYLRHPIQHGEIAVFTDGSKVSPHNIFDPLPGFMRSADLIFVDPPWNKGNLNTFYTKAGRTDYQDSFETFYKRLFECIAEIRPATCYVEVGKEYLSEFIAEAKRMYKYVTFYNSTYYHKKDSLCYVIHAGRKRKNHHLDGMDEEDIISWICKNEEYSCIGDLCMGLGLVGINAYSNNRQFVGTELNPKRLSVMIDRIVALGGHYHIN